MASLNGTTPAATYPSLIKFNDNSAISATKRLLSDGAGGATPIYLSSTQMNIGGTGLIAATLGIKGISSLDTDIAFSVQSNIARMLLQVDNSGSTRISGATARFLIGVETGGIGGHRLVVAGSSHFSPSGTGNAGACQIDVNGTTAARALFYDGSGALKNVIQASGDSYILSGNVGINIAAPTAKLYVVGTGTTSATNSFITQNSSGTASFQVRDDGVFSFNSPSGNNSCTAQGFKAYRFSANGGFGSAFLNLESVCDLYSADGTIGLRVNDAHTGITDRTSIGQTSAPVASAMLEVVSTTQGLLPPRMTTIQKNAIATAAAGLMVYDTTTNKLCCYNGTIWNDLF